MLWELGESREIVLLGCFQSVSGVGVRSVGSLYFPARIPASVLDWRRGWLRTG